MASIEVREAAPDDRLGIRRVLDAAMLDVRDGLRERIESGDVLIASEVLRISKSRAVKPRDDADDSGSILGALVLVQSERGAYDANDGDSAHVDAVAVRRARRGQGIGSLLVRTASERHPRLTAEFDADVRPFYESLGFEIEPVEGETDRFRGRYGGKPV